MEKIVDMLDLLDVTAQWLVDPNNEEYCAELNKIKSNLIIKAFLPMEAKKALVQEVIMRVTTADNPLYGFAENLELSLTFDVLMAYTNIEWRTSYEVKCAPFYDILWGSGICDEIISRCRADYERVLKLIEMSLSFSNLTSLIDTIKEINPESLEKTMQEINKLKLDIDPGVIHDLALLSRDADPLLHQMADTVEAAAYDATTQDSGDEKVVRE